jgi:hypothetical protein
LAGAAFHVAVISARRLPRLAVLAAVRGGVAMVVAVALSHWLAPEGGWLLVLSAIGALAVSTVALGLLGEGRRRARAGKAGLGLRTRAWVWLAVVDLAAFLPVIVPRPWLDWVGLGVALPALVCVPAGLAAGTWGLARALAKTEKRRRAAVTRVLACLYGVLLVVFLVTLGASDYRIPGIAAAALCLLVVISPLATTLLGGLELPVPPSPADHPEPDRARLGSDASLVLGFAVAGLLWAGHAHLDRCVGELVVVDHLPDDWPATPVVAEGIASGWLGPFRLRGIAHHHRDCGWRMHAIESWVPEYYSATALHDPNLCFGGAVALDARFDSIGIVLHHDQASDVFVVSEPGSLPQSARQPLVAFRRELGWGWRFDSRGSAWFVGLGALALVVALGLRWRGARRGRADPESRRAAQLVRWQTRVLLLAAALPWAFEGYRAALDLPTPNHELRTHQFCRYR